MPKVKEVLTISGKNSKKKGQEEESLINYDIKALKNISNKSNKEDVNDYPLVSKIVDIRSNKNK